MTDNTRADFEAFIAPKILADYNLPQALHRFDNGDYENDWIQVAWRSYEAGAQAATLAAQGKRQPLTEGDAKDAANEDVLWQLLNAVTDEMNRRAIPGTWLSLAYKTGSKFITNRRAAIASQKAATPQGNPS